MCEFQHDGLCIHFREVGSGVPFVFQHGLGGTVEQPWGLFQPPAGVRLLAMDCRGHGATRPLGPERDLRLAVFADDLAALLDHLEIEQAVMGGISMGAAVALNFAVRFAPRVLGLVLSRPAWLAEPLPPNVRCYPAMAALIRRHGAVRAKTIFMESPEYQRIARLSSDSAKSVVGQFDEPRAEDAVARLERISADAPISDMAILRSIAVPTLVLANRQDAVHPYEFGQALAGAIHSAQFLELTPKAVSADRHAADVQRMISGFLTEHFLGRMVPC